MAPTQDDLWQDYLSDVTEAFVDIEQSLLALEEDPTRVEEVNRLYRGLHTLKGNSGFMGLAQVERLAHVTEDLVGLVRDRGVPLDGPLCEILLAAHDRLRAVVNAAVERRGDAEDAATADVIASVERARAQRSEPVAASPASPASQPNASTETPQADEPLVLFAGGLADVAVEAVVPAMDEGYLDAFLSIAKERMREISGGVAELGSAVDAAARRSAAAAIVGAATDLRVAAEHMGFTAIADVLADLGATTAEDDALAVARRERALFAELLRIEETFESMTERPSSYGFASLARRSAAEQLFATLARLRSMADAFARGSKRELGEMPALLRDIRFACEHYGFHAAARSCLDQEDRYARSSTEPDVVDEGLIERTRALVAAVGKAVDDVRAGGDADDATGIAVAAPPPVDVAPLLELGLTPEVAAVVPESLAQRLFALASAGERLWVVRASLDEPALATAFQGWLTAPSREYLTSATVYVGDQTEFDFLVATRDDADVVAGQLAKLDPSGALVRLARPPSASAPGAGRARAEVGEAAGEVPGVAARLQPTSSTPAAEPAAPREEPVVDRGEARATADADAREPSAAHQTEYLRIDARKIGLIMDLAGEIGLSTGAVTQHPEVRQLDLEGFNAAAHKLEMLIRELQTEVSSMRLVPVSGVFQRMKRVVRDTAKRTGKQVDLILRGEDTEIDKFMVDSLHDPLVHLLRNAVDHGLETPEERVAAGKPPVGRIVLEATHEAGEVTVVVADDGRGIDKERVLARAVERGLTDAGARPTEPEILDFIFRPGFSTRDVVSQLSGRGVGMDVVKTTIESALHGRVQVRTNLGKGSRFVLRMPLTLAFIEAMVIQERERLYALPIEKVFEVFKVVCDSQIVRRSADHELLVRVRGSLVPVFWVHRFYGDTAVEESAADIVGKVVVVVQTSFGQLALPVDTLLGNQQVMLKPLKGVLSQVRAAAGCGMLRSGDVALALDCERLHA